MGPRVGEGLSFQGTIDAEMKEFNHPFLFKQKLIEITQGKVSRIIGEGMRFKNDELPENVLLDFLFYHIL